MGTNAPIYVCFIQDISTVTLDSVVTCLTVLNSRGKVDKWFNDKIAEAVKNGYTADEEMKDVSNIDSFEIALSKGNDEDGYESYLLICRKENIL